MTQPATQARSTRWSLEVVRGRDPGHVYDLSGGEVVLGNGLDGPGVLDLRDQEAGSPRRMAARQAVIESTGTDLIIRDLDSPGGTFVNRQRLLAGQARRLQAGDQIQLGGVQLRLTAASGPSPGGGHPPPAAASRSATAIVGQPPSAAITRPASAGGGQSPSALTPPSDPAGRLPVPYAIDGTVSCRTWDDFLVVAAQRWRALRDELSSGRLADFLRRIQRTDLLPRPDPGRSLDDQLDHWLARLPASRSSAPELDVHPAGLDVRASAGGATRHVLRVTNVGYRLLRGTARVEPPGTSWVKLVAPFDGRPFDTVEETELPVEVVVPEAMNGRLTAEVVIESNGGTRRVAVRVGLPEKPPELPVAISGPAGLPAHDFIQPLLRAIAGYSVPTRIVAGILGALVFRALVLAAGWLPVGTRGPSMAEPRLPALAALCAAIGILAGMLKGRGRRESRWLDRMTSGVAAGLFGIMAAAILYAVVITAERILGPWTSSPLAVVLLWTAGGAALAGSTVLLNPHCRPSSGASP